MPSCIETFFCEFSLIFQYNEMYDNKLEEITELDKLVLDFDPETKEELISVDKKLVKKLKPHQGQGIKFMWDACFESIEKLNENNGGGCILAHCMGLGKALIFYRRNKTVEMTHNFLLKVKPYKWSLWCTLCYHTVNKRMLKRFSSSVQVCLFYLKDAC